MKEITFDAIDDKTWQDFAVKSLRGIPYEKLLTNTIEGIKLQPLYTQESHQRYFGKRAVPFLQKIRGGLNGLGWTISQTTYAENGSDFIKNVKLSLDK